MRVIQYLCLLTLMPLTCFTQEAVCPAGAGVFYEEGGNWKPLSLLKASGTGTSGVGHALVTYSAKSIVKYREAAAPVTLSSTPRFCLSGTPETARNIIVLKLTGKKEHRELETGKASAFSGLQMEFRERDLQPMQVTALSNDSIAITPKQGFKAGQYLIMLQVSNGPFAENSGYDFGVK
jgi:hypothetical protein